MLYYTVFVVHCQQTYNKTTKFTKKCYGEICSSAVTDKIEYLILSAMEIESTYSDALTKL